MMKRKVIALVSVAVLVGIFAGAVWAAQPRTQPAAPQGQGTVLQILAEKLGITQDQLQQLWIEARTEALNRTLGAGQFGPPARMGRGAGRGITIRARDGPGPRCRR
uniref:Uncharacterized protein n=1 Tax=Acetithermum autotrophicum TaxID=1446466 RepID=H5SQV2_ACEAU|nr:hypothetical protein HGMM_OP2C019 [Candidatus Acetothermum autotrophicum]